MADAATTRWIRNASDERAVAAGCRFSEARGQHVLDFATNFLRLYEGEKAGEPLNPMPWQVEVTMRLFGWERWSDRFGRWVRRFRQASIWVPKKNGKSPTLAWWGLYLLCADGEQGQKVYFAAKDGQQAREIAGKHAMEMVLSSPAMNIDLGGECSINRTIGQITHEPTRSILKPISSGDSRAAKAKEGLNGSILVDETHVVDRDFMGRVSRAGISRSEPMMIEVSTAGSDPEGYGKSRYDYGKRVESGEEADDQLLFVAFEAPQELDAKMLAADPIKYGKMANPAWGHIVGDEEYLADYNSSKSSIAELGRFMMYRLNVWQQSESPWLNMSDWGRCKRTYTEADLLGRECYGGLDLAKTRDTSALVLSFPEPDGPHKLLPYFWLPEARAQEIANLVQYREWAAAGHVKLTPGEMVDYNLIRQEINAIRAKFSLAKLAFDDAYAHQLIQRLIEEDGMGSDVAANFDQTIKLFAGPTAAFERKVIDGKIYHPGNPLLTWQVGNTKVKEDINGNMRPVKQKRGDWRAVDGSVAAIMAEALAEEFGGSSQPSIGWL